jgi:hypothetical protein
MWDSFTGIYLFYMYGYNDTVTCLSIADINAHLYLNFCLRKIWNVTSTSWDIAHRLCILEAHVPNLSHVNKLQRTQFKNDTGKETIVFLSYAEIPTTDLQVHTASTLPTQPWLILLT